MTPCDVCGQDSFGNYLMKMGRKRISVNLCFNHLFDQSIKPFIIGEIEETIIPERKIVKIVDIDVNSPLWELVE